MLEGFWGAGRMSSTRGRLFQQSWAGTGALQCFGCAVLAQQRVLLRLAVLTWPRALRREEGTKPAGARTCTSSPSLPGRTGHTGRVGNQ